MLPVLAALTRALRFRLFGFARREAAAIVVLTAIAAWRFVQVRGLVVPAWVDSVHHTLLVRILLEHGRIPETWAPYLPSVPLYYHFGFHASAALLARVMGLAELDLGRAVLVAGQLWQVAVALGTYLLGLQLWRSRARALTAAALVGFVSQMPAHYVTWGRYTLLAGLALLLGTMAALLSRRYWAVAVLVAATAVTHYYAFALALLFAGFVCATTYGRRRLGWLALAVACGVLASWSWLARVWYWVHAFERHAGSGGGGSSAAPDVWSMMGPARSHLLILMGAAGLVLLAVRAYGADREERTAPAAVALWCATILCLLGPWQVGPFRPDHAAIVAFIPATLGATELIWTLCRPRQAVAVVAALVAWGVAETASIVRSDTVLATESDRAALRWVAASTPRDAVMLVDVKPWMGVWRGADGGWWAMPLTGRRTVLPALAYTWGPPEGAELIGRVARRVHQLGNARGVVYCAELEQLMIETGAQYYYTRTTRPLECGSLSVAFAGSPGPRVFTLARGGSLHRPEHTRAAATLGTRTAAY